MDEIVVRPKYQRQTSTPGRKKRPNENDMMSTIFAAKLLVVVVFLSVFALCKAANTPATNIFISKVKEIATENYDVNKYIVKAADVMGINLPTKLSAGQQQQNKENAGSTTDDRNVTGQGNGQTDISKAVDNKSNENQSTVNEANNNQSDNQGAGNQTNANQSENQNKGTDSEDGQNEQNAPSSGINTDTENIKVLTEVPVLGEEEIKAIAAKYSFIIPIKGDIESSFGIWTYPLSGKTAFHSGIDIKANKGTSIKAALAGEVTEAGSSPELGNFVKIKHKDGISTVYGFCSILVAQKGQKVNQGDVIAKVGDTKEGLSGSYLHFEVWKDDKAADPEKLLNLLNQ